MKLDLRYFRISFFFVMYVFLNDKKMDYVAY